MTARLSSGIVVLGTSCADGPPPAAKAPELDDRASSDESEPEMTDAELGAPMRNAAFVSGCGAPDSMKVTVKIAVQRGRAAGVSVSTTPANEGIARCVDDHVRSLRWPVKQKLDSFTTTY